jgi:hypothetical protein
MMIYDARVTREGKWWMVAIPAVDGLTQARRLADAETMAREYLALSLEVPLNEVGVRLTVESIDQIDVAAALAEIQRDREIAHAFEADARSRAEALAHRLAVANVPVRDIGTMMGVSFQRAHQLVTAHHA